MLSLEDMGSLAPLLALLFCIFTDFLQTMKFCNQFGDDPLLRCVIPVQYPRVSYCDTASCHCSVKGIQNNICGATIKQKTGTTIYLARSMQYVKLNCKFFLRYESGLE